ncbi:hypothetical protein PR048_017035 [Dryococelus australis]|uniref:Uncharacterized protein n=1 Tax=Dryococelus australis TaxID=614101 RepID=A0ABQ9H8F3_9NEOP|nr:hypothetical protein PR048_017035 [Dryococelus australis]
MSCMPLPVTEEDHDIVETVHSFMMQENRYFRKKPDETLSFPVYLKCIKGVGQLPASYHQNVRHITRFKIIIVFLGSKILVPTALRPYVFNLAHEEHDSVEKKKGRARQLFY